MKSEEEHCRVDGSDIYGELKEGKLALGKVLKLLSEDVTGAYLFVGVCI